MNRNPAIRLPAMLLGLGLAAAGAQQGDGTDVSLQANGWKPAKVPADKIRLAQLPMPATWARVRRTGGRISTDAAAAEV